MDTRQSDPNAFLMGQSIRSFKFDAIGNVARGLITDLDLQQQRDIKTGAPLFWDDGNPKMQLRIVIETAEREDAEDDGLRAVYVRGNMQAAVRDAVKLAGKTEIEVGGMLAVAFVGLGTAKQVGLNAPKLYKAEYRPPAPPAVSTDSLLPPAPGAAPVAAPAPPLVAAPEPAVNAASLLP